MSLHLSLATASAVAMIAATPAAAYAQSRAFDVAAQPAARGIVAFARQAGIQIIAPEDATRGRRTAAVRGNLPVADALRRLVAASNLRLVSFDGRTAVLAADAGARAFTPQTQADPAAGAQADPAAPSEQPVEQADAGMQGDIVVTGTRARGATVLTSSSAITAATREDLDRKAPRSTAQALELIPGIFVEASGGEVSNNFTVRGLAGGGQQFVQLQEDGLPVFYIDALSDTILKQEVSIDRLEAVRSGASGILTVNGAGATVNFITRKPDFDKASGTFQLTTSSYGTARVDAFMTKPIGPDTAISIGGFYRNTDGIRDPRYPADHGFLWRAQVAQRFDGGQLVLSAKVVDDHNIFYVPIPVTGVGDPQSIPGLSATKGTLYGPEFAQQQVRVTPTTGRSTKDVNLRDGVHTKAYTLGYDLTKDFGEAFTFFGKGRYTSFSNDFNAIFSFDNNALQLASERLDPNRGAATNPTTALALQRFGPLGANRLAIRYVDNGQIVDGAAALNAINGNGLIAESVVGNNRSSVKEFTSDTGVRWQTDNNSLTVGGLYTRSSRYNDAVGASTFLTDVRDNARRVDVVALNGAGQVVGSLTENGLLNYGTFGESPSGAKFDSVSIYAQDELKLWDKLRIDGGVRYEHYNYRGYSGNTNGRTPIAGSGTFDADGNLLVDNDNIIANNYIAQFGGSSFNGTFTPQNKKWDKVAYTIGANYLITDKFAAYGRYATGFQSQGSGEPTDLEFAEAGLRYSSGMLQASITGFMTKFKDYIFSRQFTPAGARPRDVQALSNIDVYGGEFDITLRPVDWFRLQANGVIQDSKVNVNTVVTRVDGNIVDTSQADADLVNSFDGNRPERTPAVNITVTPAIILPNGLGEIYGSWKRIGKIYADISNSLQLPGYDLFSAGILFKLNENVSASINVENIGNTIGLTEGNPRGGFVENTGSNFYFARPINGRNAVASLRIDF